jgi:hypothetical protein
LKAQRMVSLDRFSFSGRPVSPVDHWFSKNHNIQRFSHDPSARRLLEMMHSDFETQYILKIPNPQDLVKFNNLKTLSYSDIKCQNISQDTIWY